MLKSVARGTDKEDRAAAWFVAALLAFDPLAEIGPLAISKTGHAHADVNGGGRSQTYIKIVPGSHRHKVPD
jgi:hypothetical protein